MWSNLVLISFFVLSSIIHHKSTSDESHLTGSESDSVQVLQQELLPQLKSDYMKSDEFFNRWLRACSFNIARTREKLLKFIAWHENLFEREKRDLWVEKNIELTILDDKKGNPVVYFDMSKINLRKLYEKNQIDKFALYAMQAVDRATETTFDRQQTGGNESRISFLVDWTGFNYDNHLCPHCIPAYMDTVANYEAYYPLTLDKVVYFNTPVIVNGLVTLMRPLMSEELHKSCVIFGTDELDLSKKYLEDWIGNKNIPSSNLI